jgi:hypothetical protein
MAAAQDLRRFQEVLDRVAQTGQREQIREVEVPDVQSWGTLDAKGCLVSVDRGRWWVLPPT